MYTKEYFRQQLSDIISPIEKYYNGGKVQYARHSAWYENLSADVEAFARPLWGLVPFWAGGGENETFEKLYITGITSGADKKNDGYWGDCHDKDQRFVEMAAFAYGLIFAPEKVWEPLKSTAKKNFEKWLYSINDKEVCDSNWTFFRVLVNVALKKVGRKYSQEQLDKDIARIDEFYLGQRLVHRRTAWTKGLLHWFCIPFLRIDLCRCNGGRRQGAFRYIQGTCNGICKNVHILV